MRVPSRTKRSWRPWAVVAFLATGVAAAPLRAQLNDGPPKEVEGVTVEQRLGAEIPGGLRFRDDRGRRVRMADYFDGSKPVLLTLNYSSCPMLCNVQLNQLVLGLEELDLRPGADFHILSVSIDPREKPERAQSTKRQYLELLRQPGAADGWHFLTGEVESIRELTETVGFKYRYDQATGEYYHPAMLAFVTPEGVVSSYLLSADYPADQLKLGLVDAGEGRLGSPVDQFVLWCFSYDAERGNYTANAWFLMRLGGILTVVVMLMTIAPYWMVRRRAGAAAVAHPQV